MSNPNTANTLDLSSFGTKVSPDGQRVADPAALDLSAFGTPVGAGARPVDTSDPVEADASDRGFVGRRIDDAQRGWHRSMQGIDIQDLDRRTETSGLLDQIDAGTYKEPVERWERLSENPRAKQYRLADEQGRADIRATLRGKMDEDLTDLVTAENKINQLPQSPESRAFHEAEDFGAAWDVLAESPVEIISSLATESLGQQGPYLPLMALNPAIGAGAGSYMTERGADIVNSLREAGVDFTSEESIRSGLSDPERMAAFRQHASRRGLAVGLIDAISGGVAGKYAAGATTTLSRIGRGALEDLVMQPAFGAAGEAAGALAAGDEISGKDLLAEAAGEVGPGAVETTVGTIQNVRRRQTNAPDDGLRSEGIDEETGDPLGLPAPEADQVAPEQEADPVLALPRSDMTYGDGFVTGNFPDVPEPAPEQIGNEQRLALPPSRTVYDEAPLLEGPRGDALPSSDTVYGNDFVMSDEAGDTVTEPEQLPSPDQYGRIYGEGFAAGDELLPQSPGPNYVAIVDRTGNQTGWFNPETAHAVGKDLGAFEVPRRQGPSIDELTADGRSADEIRDELVENAKRERATADVGSVVRVRVPGKRSAEPVRVVGFTPDAAVVETREGQKIALADNQIPTPEKRTPTSRRSGPEDVISFLSRLGGIRDDEGHALLKSRDMRRFTPRVGPLVRKTGMSIDDAGEALHEAGYFGPPATTPRPDTSEVLDLLERAMSSPAYTAEDQADVFKAQEEIAARDAAELEAEMRAEIKAVSRELGEIFSTSDIAAIMKIMVDEKTDAETAISEYAERQAIQYAEAIYQERLEQDEDAIPFFADEVRPDQDGGTSGRSRDGRQDQRENTDRRETGGTTASQGRSAARETQQPVTDNTDQGQQTVIPGAERITDRALAERRMDGRKSSSKPQKDADFGLFDTGARNQQDMFDAPPPQQEAQTEMNTKTPAIAAGVSDSELRRGEVGMLLAPGEVVLTSTGRETTPFPRIDLGSSRKASNTIKRVDQWLMQNALDEANARGDEFNARSFSAQIAKPSQSDKDSAESYLFDPDFNFGPSEPSLRPLGADAKTTSDAEYEGNASASGGYDFAAHNATVDRLKNGDISPAELLASYKSFMENFDPIKAELAKQTKAELARYSLRGKNEKKDVLVNSAMDALRGQYNTSDSISYSPFEQGSKDAAYLKAVEETTADDISRFAKRVAEANEARSAYAAEINKAISNPETYEEFRQFVRYRGADALSDDQRVRYDELIAEKNYANREAERKESRKVSAVDLGDTDMEIVETKHTRDGYDLFVVRLGDRVEKEVYKDLLAKAKQLGGWYSRFRGNGAVPGFQFKSREAAESFVALRDGDSLKPDTSEDKAAKATDQLRDAAAKIDEKADEKLSADRKINTARRASMAANAEAAANKDKMTAETMKNIADAIESGKAKHLSQIRFRTDIDMLNSLLRQAQYERIRTEKIKANWDDLPALSAEDVKHVKYPFPSAHGDHVTSVAQAMLQMSGFKLVGKRLQDKALKALRSGAYRVEFNTDRDIADFDKMVQAASQAKSIGSYIADDLKEAKANYGRALRLGLPDTPTLRAGLREFLQYRGASAKVDPVKAAERALIGTNIPGYFPTPNKLVERMIDEASIEEGMTVLEPSAGKGSIADSIREITSSVDVVEPVSSLRGILEAKGHNIVGSDFLDFTGKYDRIIMNPPFEKRQDVDHVRHAFEQLAPGGRLVAIMSEGPFFGSDKKAIEFREWLEAAGGVSEKNPEGSFKDSDRSTGVATRIVTIDRSDERYSLKRDITKTDAFKRWFGDSKVVDRKGDPLVVYHGTPDARGLLDQNGAFRKSDSDTEAYFFTNNRSVARTYADDKRAFDFQNAENAIGQMYLSIKNPMVIDAQGQSWGQRGGPASQKEQIVEAKAKGHDGLIIRDTLDTYSVDGSQLSDVYVAFNPKQIKSAENGPVRIIHDGAALKGSGPNSGAFDPNDARLRYRLSDQKSQKRTQLEEAVIAEIKRLSPAVRVEIRKNGKTLVGGKKADAGYIPVDDLIWTAMDAADPTHAGRHEVVHHLRATGRITDAEWSILQRKAKSTWRKQYRVDDYREQYAGDADIETVLDEEAVAEAFADWMDGGSDAKGGIARIFRKIKQFFDRIASVVRGQGYQSAEDVFRSIDEGEVGKRATNDLEKMKQQRSEYFAMSGLRKKSGSAAAKPKQKASPLNAAQEAAIKRTMANIEDEQSVGVRIRETLADAVDYIKYGSVQHIFDQFDSIKRYEKATYGELKRASMSAYKMARMTTNLSSTMAAVLRHGPLEYKNGAFQVRKGFDGGFEAIFADLADRGLLKAWKGWAVANRAARLAKEGRENNMTAQDIALLKDLDKQYPEFREVMKRWTAFNKAMLDMAEQTGLLDPDARALFENDDYVPFYRAIDDTPTGPFRKKGLANQRSGINRLKGGEAEVNDLIDNMVRNMTQLVDASMKNVAAKRVLRTLKTAGLDDGSVIMKVPHDAVPVHVTPEEAAQALENIGVQVQGMTKQQHDQWLKLFTLRPPKDPDVVSVMVGGKPQYFRVNDPLLLSSMTSLGMERVHWLVSILGYPKRWLTTGVTATPGFMLRNFIRDSLHGWVVSGEKFRPGIDGFRGAVRSYREDTALVNIMAAGGGSGGFFRTQSRDVAKMLSSVHGKNAIIDSPKKSWEWWKRVGQATENANRLAIYDSVLKDTGDVAEAAYQALDIMDFSMRGDSAVIRFLIGTIPFLNARMQGLYRLGRGLKQNPKAFMLRGGLITAATMLLYSLNADDDRYDELPEWEKDAYYHIFLDRIFPEEALKAAGIPFDEFHIRLPKPFEVGALFSTIPERATRLAQGKDDLGKYGERMWTMVRDTFAVDLPQFVKPLAEQWANEVTFTGSPIIPERMQDLEPEAQYDARTSELAKQIGEALPDFMGDAKSPKRIEAAVRAFFGSYGVYVMGIADEILDPVVDNPVEPDLRGDQLPEVGSFIRQQPYRSTRFVSEFYDLKREIEAVAKTYKQYRSQGQIEDAKDITEDGGSKKIAMAGWMRRKAKQMSNINKKMRAVEESRSLTSAQKRKQIDQLSVQRNELAEQVVKALNKAGIK